MTAEVGEVDGDLSPWREAGVRARHRRRRLLLGVVVAFTVLTALFGFPTGREVITFWVLLTLLAACGGDLRVWKRAVVRDWLPLLLVLLFYDLMRGLANEIGGALFGLQPWLSNLDDATSSAPSMARAHLTEPLNADQALFGGHVPTVWLQQHLFDPGVAHWYDTIAIPIYLSHFLVSLALALVLWCVNYRLFRKYLVVLVTLTVATMLTYMLYPAAPPWMATLNGRLPDVHRVVQESILVLGGQTLNSAVEQGAAYSNPVAAVPSLHAAVPMMLLLFFWPVVRRRFRLLLGLYAALMAMVLVYGGEHYVVDVLLGWVYAIGAVVGAKLFADRRSRRTAVGL